MSSDWPQWRGPDRSGVTPERSGWPGGWPPKRLWSASVGAGCTSPVIADGAVYVMGFQGARRGAGTDVVYCFDALSGKELWRQSYPCRYQGRVHTGDEGAYGGPSSTPAFDAAGKLLYTLSIDGDLRCWDAGQKGRCVWAKNLYDEYRIRQRPNVGGGTRDYGFTSSPLILGDLLVVEVGADDGTVMAFDRKTGQRVWASAAKGPAGHSSGPAPITYRGASCLASLTVRGLVVMRADKGNEGRTVAEVVRATDFGCNIATPAVAGEKVVVTSAYNQSNTALTDLSAGLRPQWRSKAHNTVASPVIYKDNVFLAEKAFSCLDLATGNVRWRGGSFGMATCLVTAGDDKVIVFGQGQLALLDACPSDGQYKELSRADGKLVRGTCYPHVAMARGVICCKDKDGDLVCLSVRGGADQTPGR